ncbi:hypothetical protein EYM_07030 [Ignicoccus islandicus DSM 13165]|uniref:AAA+ ATPase domain-containing protein n=1 Tax=Ignicoccus islandicus DSM 13165 TaxID=940295 RepID=A0A0U3G3K4_9CREN|nr:AAA family ATPase [Ignicoccus islandicus]ALU12748.1 hypothetical protein EYM_07030 [Ignicoccus islandicus DSM 13165]
MSSRESSKGTPFPSKGHVALYGPAGVGKTSLVLHMINNVYCGSSLYILTEDPANLERLKCDESEVLKADDFKELLFYLIKNFDKYDFIAIDSVSHVLRTLPPELGVKVAMTVSWLMRKGSNKGLRVSVHQVSFEGEMSYGNFVEPWADCIGKIEKEGGYRLLELQCNGNIELVCFEISSGGVSWVNC